MKTPKLKKGVLYQLESGLVVELVWHGSDGQPIVRDVATSDPEDSFGGPLRVVGEFTGTRDEAIAATKAALVKLAAEEAARGATARAERQKGVISPRVREILSRATITADSVTLPPGRLARDLYEEVDRVLRDAGGRWNRQGQCHTFDRDPRGLLGLAIETGQSTNVQQKLQAFYTPAAVATRVVELSGLPAKGKPSVLEPSAGEGALAEAVLARCPGARVSCYDTDEVAVAKLREKGLAADQVDFLAVTPKLRHDYVVMNPPFTRGQDIRHVLHALRFLAPGGVLVSVMSAGVTFGTSGLHEQFKAELERRGGTIEELPEGAFKASGTGAKTVVVVMREPGYYSIKTKRAKKVKAQ